MADILEVRDAYRAQHWAMVVQECVASGLSNREFCRQRGIAEKNFYYCQRKLRAQIVESASPQLVPLGSPPAPDEQLCIQYRCAELVGAGDLTVDDTVTGIAAGVGGLGLVDGVQHQVETGIADAVNGHLHPMTVSRANQIVELV